MAKRFQQVTLDTIKEGDFIEEARAAFLDLQKSIGDHAKYHKERAKDATATLTIQVALKVTSIDDGDTGIAIVTAITTKNPTAPKGVTQGYIALSQTGEPEVHAPYSGSVEDNPRQARLFGATAESED